MHECATLGNKDEDESQVTKIHGFLLAMHASTFRAPVKYTENALYSLMYAVQLAISYILMLVAMTFNVYLFLAIVLGVGFGHFVYAWTRP